MNKSYLLLGTACLLMSSAAQAQTTSSDAETHIKQTDDGNYSATSKSQDTDAAGTTSARDENVKMKTDSDGASDKTVTTTKSTDPKGLMNKTTDKTTDETQKSANGTTTHKHKRAVNGKTVEQSKSTTGTATNAPTN